MKRGPAEAGTPNWVSNAGANSKGKGRLSKNLGCDLMRTWNWKGLQKRAVPGPRQDDTVDHSAGMNAIGVIVPYRYEGMWVFDDPAAGLSREPFIAGIDTMIDRLVAAIPEAGQGFRLLFSASPFPGHAVKLEWRREEAGGNWYFCPQFGIEGWLCPALFKYFDQAPRELYARAEARK